MEPDSSPVVAKELWFVIFGVFVAALIFVWLALWAVTQTDKAQPSAPNIIAVRPLLQAWRPTLIISALAFLLSSWAWLRFFVGTGGAGIADSLSLLQFQMHTVAALLLAAACTLCGAALCNFGLPFGEFSVFALGTLLVDLGLILPMGRAFWAARKQ